MNNFINLIRPDLLKFNAYSSARDEAKEGKVWLNANESPYTFKTKNKLLINRYPEKQPQHLIKLLATHFKINTTQLVLSRGSDEVIDLLIRLFCSAGKDAIMICPPTFGMYSVSAALQGAEVIKIPLIEETGFQLDLSAILDGYKPQVKIIFLCSPNNPTGNLIKKEDILYLCQQFKNKCLIVVDEAYIEFSDQPSLSSYINDFDNLVILRTFSKAYGLAGARCGLLMAQEELVQWLLKIIPPYPVPVFTAQAVFHTLSKKQKKISKQIKAIKTERERLINTLSMFAFVKKIWPSEANFILIKTNNSQLLMRECCRNGVVIRDMNDKPGLEHCVRISIGLEKENNQIIKIIKMMESTL